MNSNFYIVFPTILAVNVKLSNEWAKNTVAIGKNVGLSFYVDTCVVDGMV